MRRHKYGEEVFLYFITDRPYTERDRVGGRGGGGETETDRYKDRERSRETEIKRQRGRLAIGFLLIPFAKLPDGPDRALPASSKTTETLGRD